MSLLVTKSNNIEEWSCSPKYTKQCMDRECNISEETELEISTFDPGSQTSWYKWKGKAEKRLKKKNDGCEEITVHSTVKEKVDGTLHTLLEDFSTEGKPDDNINNSWWSERTFVKC
ncbi:uncharacterized protein V6R79_003227 [Siganus canaliculatus]